MGGWRRKGDPVKLLDRARKATAQTGPVAQAMTRELRAVVQQNVTAQRYGDGTPWPPRRRAVRGRVKMLLRVPRNLLYAVASRIRGRRAAILVQDNNRPHYKYQVRYGAPSRNLPERSPFPRGRGIDAFKASLSAWLRSRLDQLLGA